MYKVMLFNLCIVYDVCPVTVEVAIDFLGPGNTKGMAVLYWKERVYRRGPACLG
jgi:hypothetical protein